MPGRQQRTPGLSGLSPSRRELFLRTRTYNLWDSLYIFIVSWGQERQMCVLCICNCMLKKRQQGEKKISQVNLRENWCDRVWGTAVASKHQREQEEQTKGTGASTSCWAAANSGHWEGPACQLHWIHSLSQPEEKLRAPRAIERGRNSPSKHTDLSFESAAWAYPIQVHFCY